MASALEGKEETSVKVVSTVAVPASTTAAAAAVEADAVEKASDPDDLSKATVPTSTALVVVESAKTVEAPPVQSTAPAVVSTPAPNIDDNVRAIMGTEQTSPIELSQLGVIVAKCTELVEFPAGNSESVVSDVSSERTIKLPEWSDSIVEKLGKKLPFIKPSYTIKFRSHVGNELDIKNGDWSLSVKSGDAGWWQGVMFKLKDGKSGTDIGFDSNMELDRNNAESMAKLVKAVLKFADDKAKSPDEEMRRWAADIKTWYHATALSGRKLDQVAAKYLPEQKVGSFSERLSAAYEDALKQARA